MAIEITQSNGRAEGTAVPPVGRIAADATLGISEQASGVRGRQALNVSDIVIHISETLDDSGIHGLQRQISESNGVYSACMHEKTRHLMVVDFDPMQVRPSHLVQAVRARGLHAVMVGL